MSFFMCKLPVYIVSLKNSERQLDIGKRILNVNYDVIEAIYGKDLGETYLETINSQNWVIERYKRSLTYGEIGCALSHLKIYKKM